MIYDFPASDDPIRQGDIFVAVPRIELSLSRLFVLDSQGDETETDWDKLVRQGESVATALLPMRTVPAIVVTQDCDAIRAQDITLCEIRPFREVEGKAKNTQKAKSWVDIITQQSRINLKWFYLPPDFRVGFQTKMAVDFRVTIRLDREELEAVKHLRKARLNDTAEAHFREKIGDFFRRFPYDEWYSLSKEELEAYKRDHPDADPYEWQK